MAELCLVGYTYRGYPLAYALQKARAFGYHGVELRNFSDIDLRTVAGVRDAVQRATQGTRELGLMLQSVFYSPLPVSRGAEREGEDRQFRAVLSILAEAGIPILHTHVSLRREDGAGETASALAREADYAIVCEALRRMAAQAERTGVRIALETHMETIHDTAAAQLRLVSAVASPHLVASLDYANMLITCRSESLVEAVRSFGPQIGYCHVKNVKLTPWGYDWNVLVRWGDINYHHVLQALAQVGYRGPLAVEYCGTGDPDVFAEDDARYLRDLTARVGL